MFSGRKLAHATRPGRTHDRSQQNALSRQERIVATLVVLVLVALFILLFWLAMISSPPEESWWPESTYPMP